jgi:uncharacterized DUF497 family protein
MRFEWDEEKNILNHRKHGVWFEEAQTVFADDLGRVFVDEENSANEERFLVIGLSSAARILMVVHCYRKFDSVIRINSARKATKKEQKIYEERI